MSQDQVPTDIYDAIKIRRNKKGILESGQGVSPRVLSICMDLCIDEEAIDSLVELGGDPSCVTMGYIDYDLSIVDHARVMTRRMYHGAIFPESCILDAYKFKDMFDLSKVTESMVKRAVRRKKYEKVEEEKFDYWTREFPYLFTHQDDVADIGSDYSLYKYRESWSLYRPGKVNKVVYLPFEDITYVNPVGGKISPIEWMMCEVAFGKYHRQFNIVLHCIRSSKRKDTKKPRVSKSPLKNGLDLIGLDLSRLILSYV